MKSSIIVFPGSNCDRDVAVAIKNVTNTTAQMLWHKETSINNTDLIILPGGFSHGDYLRSGSIASRAPIMKEVIKYANNGIPVVGICNGFQILTECGLLPGVLMRNKNMNFICKYVNLISKNKNLWVKDNEINKVISYPVAHHDGNYFANKDDLEILVKNNRIVFQYCSNDGKIDEKANINGSVNNIAGITNDNGNVLGMMPHPERAIDNRLGGSDGINFFENILNVIGT
tara:strand:- start:1031 stop:1720 length:690 start_codon:yes stop_codon:yes gene_type:complete